MSATACQRQGRHPLRFGVPLALKRLPARIGSALTHSPPSLPGDASLGRGAGAQERVDLSAGQRPVLVEIGDDRLHERLRERDGAVLVAQVVVENGQSQLLRAFAFIGPFEAIPGEPFDLVVLVERAAVDRHDQSVDGALSLVGLHWLVSRFRRSYPFAAHARTNVGAKGTLANLYDSSVALDLTFL